jgi:putative phosphoribosyl transferase
MESFPSASLREAGFANRHHAGRELARALGDGGVVGASDDRVVVVGLARGGVEVAAEIAAALHAPLDALAVRKVGHPWQPEYGIGAVAPGGVTYVRSRDGLTEDEVAGAVRAAQAKADALDATLHARCAPVVIEGATCILADDGLATGGTMTAAIRWARANGARRVIVAVPVGADATVRRFEASRDIDAVTCLLRPLDFGAVGFWYTDFRQVSDERVLALLASRPRDESSLRPGEKILAEDVVLDGDLTVPPCPRGWVIFAHGSGSSRRSPRNIAVAEVLNRAGIATLLLDLLTSEEELDREKVFDVELLARRLLGATHWLAERPEAHDLPIGYFGASTGAAAALIAAAELGDEISAVVSRGGRPDLAHGVLKEVRSPTLLVVGGANSVVLELNEDAAARLTCPHALEVVPGATHLFEEPGALDRVASLAASWFTRQFASARRPLATAR